MAPQKNVSTDMDFGSLFKMKCINLSFHSLHDGNISILVKAIEKSEVLEQLNLWSNRIAFSDDKLADAIAKCSTLQVLSLGSNAVGPAGMARLAGAIKRSASLREIHLGDNALGNEGAESFAEALMVNESLEMISLYGNGIGDWGAEVLASALAKNGHVRAAWLHENKIGDKGAKRLSAVLDVNPMLEQLFLVGNSIVDKEIVPGIEAKLADPVRSGQRAGRLLAWEQKRQLQTLQHEGEATNLKPTESDSRKDELLSMKDKEIALLKAALESKDKKVHAKDEVARRKDEETETWAKDREIATLKEALKRRDEETQLVIQAMQTKVKEVTAKAIEIDNLKVSLRMALKIQISHKDEELAALKALLDRSSAGKPVAEESDEESGATEESAAVDKLIIRPRRAAADPPMENSKEDTRDEPSTTFVAARVAALE